MDKNSVAPKKIIIILLIVSIVFNISLLLYILNSNNSKSIIGTYCTNAGTQKDGLYLVFDQGGFYTLYKQFELIDEGTYEMAQENAVYSLYSTKTQETSYAAFNGNDQIYYHSGEIMDIYMKIDSTAVYINLPEKVVAD